MTNMIIIVPIMYTIMGSSVFENRPIFTMVATVTDKL